MNAAVDDAAALAEGCARLLAAARAQGKLPPADRKRAQMLLVNVHVRAPRLAAARLWPSSLVPGLAAGGWHAARCPAGAVHVTGWRQPGEHPERDRLAHACQTCRHQQRAWQIGASFRAIRRSAHGMVEPPRG